MRQRWNANPAGLTEEWFSFESGPPHCNFRHRIQYFGTSGVITVTDPAKETYTTTSFTNSSYVKQKCIVTDPAPLPPGKCINAIEAIGAQYTFSGVEACPGSKSAYTCNVWINKGRFSPQQQLTITITYYFIVGTSTAVQYRVNSTSAVGSSDESILDFTEWSVNSPVPAGAWVTPPDWQPCTKPTSSSSLPTLSPPTAGLAAYHVSALK